MDLVMIFYDLETTGLKADRHGIHQLSGCVEINGEVVEEFNLRMHPREGVEYDPAALLVGGRTQAQIEAEKPQDVVFKDFKRMLEKYVDKYNTKDKIWLAGYNNRGFDDIFLRRWFEDNGDKYFGSWFWPDTIDILVLAADYLKGHRRRMMPNFKLRSVAAALGLWVDEERLHDAQYDIDLTRQIYQIVSRKEQEGLL